MRSRTLAAVLAALLAGCYGAAPPKPTKIVLPKLSPGTPIDVDSKTTTRIENVPKKSVSCPQGHIEGSPACIVTRYSVREPVQRTVTKSAYGGQPLNQAQFEVLTDPEYDEKLRQLEKHSKACTLANVPRWVGISLSVAGAIALGFAAWKQVPALTYGGAGAAGGGIASYALGYYAFGGKRCNEARAVYRRVELSDQIAVTQVRGPSAAKDLKERADRYNTTSKQQVGAAKETAPAAIDEDVSGMLDEGELQ